MAYPLTYKTNCQSNSLLEAHAGRLSWFLTSPCRSGLVLSHHRLGTDRDSILRDKLTSHDRTTQGRNVYKCGLGHPSEEMG